MRISDWSSDVCSSDLLAKYGQARPLPGAKRQSKTAFGDRGRRRLNATSSCLCVFARNQRHPYFGPSRLCGRTANGNFYFNSFSPRKAAASIRCRNRRRVAERPHARSEEHTSELQSLMRISYAVFCLKKNKT